MSSILRLSHLSCVTEIKKFALLCTVWSGAYMYRNLKPALQAAVLSGEPHTCTSPHGCIKYNACLSNNLSLTQTLSQSLSIETFGKSQWSTLPVALIQLGIGSAIYLLPVTGGWLVTDLPTYAPHCYAGDLQYRSLVLYGTHAC